jgi:hypothetical protein
MPSAEQCADEAAGTPSSCSTHVTSDDRRLSSRARNHAIPLISPAVVPPSEISKPSRYRTLPPESPLTHLCLLAPQRVMRETRVAASSPPHPLSALPSPIEASTSTLASRKTFAYLFIPAREIYAGCARGVISATMPRSQNPIVLLRQADIGLDGLLPHFLRPKNCGRDSVRLRYGHDALDRRFPQVPPPTPK